MCKDTDIKIGITYLDNHYFYIAPQFSNSRLFIWAKIVKNFFFNAKVYGVYKYMTYMVALLLNLCAIAYRGMVNVTSEAKFYKERH